MDTTTSGAIVSAVTTGVSSIVGFSTGAILVVLVGLIVVGLALRIGINAFKRHAHSVSG